jgi:hypothetical protein
VFVTHNVKEFSATNADQRLPHPDIAQYFSRIKSRYFIKLVDALRATGGEALVGNAVDGEGRRRQRDIENRQVEFAGMPLC